MLCNTTSSLIVRGAESAVHCGEAASGGSPAPAPRSAAQGRAVGGGGGEARGGGGGGAGGGMTGEAAGWTGDAAATSGAAREGGGAAAAAAAAARTAAPSLGERRREEEQRRSLAVDGSAFEPGSPCHCDRRARERRSRARRHSRRARDLRGVGSPEGSGLLGRRPAARKEAGAAEAA